jgi:MFS transporter, ACS family, tartrate transporter
MVAVLLNPQSDGDLPQPGAPEASANVEESTAAAVLSKVSWRLFPLMLLLYIINYLDRINVSFAGPPMQKALGFGEETFGFGAGLFFIGYFLFGVPSNLMLVKVGARRWIAAITVVWGIVSMSMSLINNETWFYVVRFLLGVAEAGFFPGMILYLTYWFPRREHAKAVARFMTAIPVAGVLGGIVSGKILLMHGVMGLPGWKWLFIITGVPAVFLGLIVVFLLSDGPASCRWLTDRESSWLVEKIASEHETSPQAKASPGLDVFANLRVWHMALLYFCLTLGMYGFQLWLPRIIMSFGQLDESQAAFLSAIPALFQALGMVLVAGSSDRRQERRYHVAGSAVLAASGLLLCGICHNPILSLACLCLAAFGIWGTVGPFWAIPTSYLRAATAAAGIGFINSVGNLGGFAGPYLVGFIKARTPDFVYSMAALALSLVVAALLVLAAKSRDSEG